MVISITQSPCILLSLPRFTGSLHPIHTAILLCCALTSCSLLTRTPGKQDFSAYTEAVFYRQNEVHGRLLLLMLDSDDQRLFAEEDRILKACKPLNKLVISTIQHKSPGLLAQYNAKRSICKCDQVSMDVRRYLQEISGEVLDP